MPKAIEINLKKKSFFITGNNTDKNNKWKI